MPILRQQLPRSRLGTQNHMAWNEPGNGRGPWGDRNKGEVASSLDQLLRRFRDKVFSSGGGGSGAGNRPTGSGSGRPAPKFLFAVIAAFVVVWQLTGFYIVQPGQKGVVLRFGDYQLTTGPGWHWHLPYPISNVLKVDTQRVRSAQNNAIMLTKDENIVDVRVAVQYRISDAEDYLFNVRDPDATVEQGLRSAVREIVGTSRMNQVIQEGVQVSDLTLKVLGNVDGNDSGGDEEEVDTLSEFETKLRPKIEAQLEDYPKIDSRSRAMLPQNINSILQAMLDDYGAGVKIIGVNVQYAQPPEPVQGAFEEAIKAREEEERRKNIARAYARDVVGRAEGEAASILLAARGYREEKIAHARGETARFSALLEEYEQAPEVTRERLYLESMGEVLRDSNLIMLGNDEGGPLMYMPLQEMLEQSPAGKTTRITGGDNSSEGDNKNLRPDRASSSSEPLRGREQVP